MGRQPRGRYGTAAHGSVTSRANHYIYAVHVCFSYVSLWLSQSYNRFINVLKCIKIFFFFIYLFSTFRHCLKVKMVSTFLQLYRIFPDKINESSNSFLLRTGYGNLTPRTEWGKVATILYAILGMPLMLLYMSNVGEVLAQIFKFIYFKACR